jgi:hypothetical protein
MSLTIHLILKSLLNTIVISTPASKSIMCFYTSWDTPGSCRVSVLIAVTTRGFCNSVTVTAPKVVDDSTDILEEAKLEDELSALISDPN